MGKHIAQGNLSAMKFQRTRRSKPQKDTPNIDASQQELFTCRRQKQKVRSPQPCLIDNEKMTTTKNDPKQGQRTHCPSDFFSPSPADMVHVARAGRWRVTGSAAPATKAMVKMEEEEEVQ